MSDNPFFPVEIVAPSSIAIPGYTGAFSHPGNHYRMVVSPATEGGGKILGLLDTDRGLMTNNQIKGYVEREFRGHISFAHEVHFGGRESELVFIMNDWSRTHRGFTFKYCIRVRNSYDLSVNKHVLVGLACYHENLVFIPHNRVAPITTFIPKFPLKETKASKYMALPYGLFGQLRAHADAVFDVMVDDIIAMTRITVERDRVNRQRADMSEASGVNSWNMRNTISRLGTEGNLGDLLIANCHYLSRICLSAGKSSPAMQRYRRYVKLAAHLESHSDEIRIALGEYHEEIEDQQQTNTDDGGDSGIVIVAGDPDTQRGNDPDFTIFDDTVR